MVIPPVLFYALGAMLTVFGALRAWHFGRRRRREPLAGADVEGAESGESPRERAGRRRHLWMGLAWVLMGLYVVYTAVGLQRQQAALEADPTTGGAAPSGPPRVRLGAPD